MGINGSRSFTLCRWSLIVAFLVVVLFGETCKAKDGSTNCTSSCGNIHNISYPFRLKDDPKHCGIVMNTLSCENDIAVLDLPPYGKYHVQAINYDNQTIRLVDPGLVDNSCSSVPRNIPPLSSRLYTRYPVPLLTVIYYMKCSKPVNSSTYIDPAPCLNSTSAISMSQPKTYIYLKVGRVEVEDLKEGCSAEWMALAMLNLLNYSYSDYNGSYTIIQSALTYGFELKVMTPGEARLCENQWTTNQKCFPHTIPGLIRLLWEAIREFFRRGGVNCDWWPCDRINGKWVEGRWLPLICIGLLCLVRTIFGAPTATAFLIYKWRRRHLSMYSTIEDFLQSDNNFLPIRYSYSEIKKMTCKFKDKLGEGGYGSVYKAKLRSGRFVAIKILGKAKGNGQDFTNEVATIGRIHHVNVVQLVGYCVEGSKRALVYDFMPNGSLDKYIYSKEGSIPLSYKKMHEISLGVAQGIEYLHQGCEMQILHFDIKPHNILLDENFNAKVSDFGLAKLYPVDNSIVSLTAARGTMGYIAPELFYKNIGGVSYKADVYSFGMLLLEMGSRRKNWKTVIEHSSQTYFPLWAYEQYKEGNDLEMGDATEEEKKIIRKMVITALWCIQMNPSERPSMNKVIEMLGGDVECLIMPSRPFLYPQEMHVGDVQHNSNPTGSMTWTLSAR